MATGPSHQWLLQTTAGCIDSHLFNTYVVLSIDNNGFMTQIHDHKTHQVIHLIYQAVISDAANPYHHCRYVQILHDYSPNMGRWKTAWVRSAQNLQCHWKIYIKSGLFAVQPLLTFHNKNQRKYLKLRIFTTNISYLFPVPKAQLPEEGELCT